MFNFDTREIRKVDEMKKASADVSQVARYEDLFGNMDRVFEGLFGGKPVPTNGTRSLRPIWDVSETEKEYELNIELPGLSREEIGLEVVDGALVIRGKKQIERNKEGVKFHQIERRDGEFERSIQFPEEVDLEQVEAKLADGVLSVRVPKAEKVQPRKIEIQ